ncbi:Tim9-like protein [Blastocystis sp. ATCC 50177/Nand II]|uniref:Mitochondrial import inner membrane translocase subunit n=1 Tax=Blastocystis sp. subtype 1 (strain ATCC 50177 / NandII) TaxID=478820 RepID=A0A196SI03_BLAHN|nr:Tim9-like protein [Blastocystis sp. ATCC 50177/Nand II]
MDGAGLNPAESAVFENRMKMLEVEQATMSSNQAVQQCFTSCARNFRTKKLDSSEEDCIRRCTERFVEATNRIATRFQEIQSLAEQQKPTN